MSLPSRLLLAAATIAAASSAHAATSTKAATGTDLTGASLGVWTGGSGTNGSPTSADVATWGATSLGSGLTIGTDVSWGSINITGAAQNIDISGAGKITTGNITLAGSQTLSIANNIALSANSNYNIADVTGTAATDTTISGVISGTGFGFTKIGAGTLLLSNTNTFTGNAWINGGTVVVSADNALGTGQFVVQSGTLAASTGSVITLGNQGALSFQFGGGGSTFNFGDANNTGSLIFSGTNPTLGGNPKNLSVADGTTVTFQSTMGGNGNASLTKTGNGTLILAAGAIYGAGTTITAGTLGGTGTIGAVTVNGTIRGGTGAVASGTLTVGNITLASGSIIELALGAGGAHSSLNFNGTESFQANQEFKFLDLGATTGSYDNLISGVGAGVVTTGWSISNEGWIGTFTNDGTGGIDLNISAVPEPSTYGLIGAGVLALAAGVRRRRKFAGAVA